MKKDTLFKHKEVVITCEENMGNANEYWKLLEPLTKQEKVSKGRKTYVICVNK
jgi:hypothetical protein